MFNEKGQLTVPFEDLEFSEDELMLMALEAGAEDIDNDGENYLVYTAPDDLEGVQKALLDQKVPVSEAIVNQIAQNTIEISDPEQAKKMIRLMDALEEHDDVQGVYANFELAESLSDEDLE
jgi:transcriptional/translational regulatory protein YebC/TACO1